MAMMMTMTTASDKRLINSGQWGLSLIEAMVVVLMLAILFLGIAHVLSRGLVSQGFMNIQNIALLEMREGLQKPGTGVADLCGTATPESFVVGNKSVGVSSTCKSNPVDIKVGALEKITINSSSVVLQTVSDELFGDDGGEIELSSD